MAKFSIFRDDDDEDEEFSVRSPKRRRTSENPSFSQPSQNEDEFSDHRRQQPQTRLKDDNHNDDDADSVDEPTKSGSMPVILSDPDVLDCSICFNPLTIPVFQVHSGFPTHFFQISFEFSEGFSLFC